MIAESQRGSALVLALLIVFILTLLGTSFLLMAQTESRIARNEKRAAQARYLAEAGLQAVKGWFDRPGTALGFPTPSQIDRAERQILDPTDPYGPFLATTPIYKNNIDLDGDPGSLDDIFQRPYRGDDENTFLGTAAGPDVLIEDDGTTAERQLLIDLTASLVGEFPAAGTNVHARISRIAVRAPPYILAAGEWTRMGVATVEVTARIYRGVAEAIASEQTISAVFNEIPYSARIFGPLHVCGDLSVQDAFPVHWGAITARGSVVVPDDTQEGYPRLIPPGPRADRWWTSTASDVQDYVTGTCNLAGLEDPWFRLIGRTTVVDTDPSDDPPPSPLVTWQPWPSVAPPTPPFCADRSNVVAEHPFVPCPAYDYDFWKRLARSGAPDTHFYVHQSGSLFLEEGSSGAVATFQDLTKNAVGLHFFDTNDGQPPLEDGSNLTGPITLVGPWQPRGFFFVNSETFITAGLNSGPPAVTVRPPAEPLFDVNGNGDFDSGVDEWINLLYPADLVTDPMIDKDDTLQDDGTTVGMIVWNRLGLPLSTGVNFQGVLFNTGDMELAGPEGVLYGAVIAGGDVEIQGSTFSPGSGVFWDDSIGRDWPPPALRLPLVAITRWNSLP